MRRSMSDWFSCSLSFLLRARQKTAHFRISRMRQKLLGVAACDHRASFGVEEHAVVADRENTCQLVGDDNNGSAEAVAQFKNQVVEKTGADRV